MRTCRNAMEDAVYKFADEEMNKVGCCCCSSCRDDVITYALNRLPPKYYSTLEGEMLTLLATIENQLSADIVFQLSEGAKLVRDHPKHNAIRTPQDVEDSK